MYYAEKLAEWVVSLKFEHIPKEAVEKAKTCVADWVGIALYGSDSPWARTLAGIVGEIGGKEESVVLGQHHKVPSANAAMVNAVMSLAYDLSDTYPRLELHPSCAIVASALAMAERENSNGRDFLTSVVVGYEVMTRVAEALNRRPDSFTSLKGYDANSIFPPFGAAAVAGKLLGLDEEEMANALGLAGGSMGGATIEYLLDGSWSYRWGPGRAAHDGILNALMAKKGFVGPHAVFEGRWDDKGRYGIINAFAGDMKYAGDLVQGLGHKWNIKDIAFKYYGCCHYIHGYNDAALKLMREYHVAPEEVEEITAWLPHMTLFLAVPRELKLRPPNLTVAQWSLPVCLAVVMTDGHLLDPRKQLSEERLKEQGILQLADRVKVIRDRQLDAIFAEEGALKSPLKIRLKNGAEYETVSGCKGFPGSPLTAEELDHKFRRLASTVLDESRIESVTASLNEVEGVDRVADLVRLLSP